MNQDAPKRFARGNQLGRRSVKGRSGNAGDLPARVREARQLVGEYLRKAIERPAALLDLEDPRVAIAAAEALRQRP